MRRRISIVALVFMVAFTAVAVFPNTASAAGTTLSASDIAFVGINSDGDDDFALLLLRDIAVGTSFYITDKGWNDGSGFSDYGGDGIVKWTADSNLAAGTVIRIRTSVNGVLKDDVSGEINLDTTSGTVIWIDSNDNELIYSTETSGQYMTVSYTGDQIFLYQGTHANPVFIAGVHYNVETGSTTGNWDGVADSAVTSALPDQLANGVNAIWVYQQDATPTERDNFRYDGSTATGTPDELRTAIYNLDNWDVDSTNTTAYTLNPYPYTFTVEGNAAPNIVTNDVLTVSEGGGGSLQSKLSATDDEDVDATLTYTVTDAPDNGNLSMSAFTQAQIDAGSVTYTHNGSNTTSDAFTFKVSDSEGGELTNQTFSITVTPVDDDAPTMTTNDGLTLNEGSSASLAAYLAATDTEIDDDAIIYTVTVTPDVGSLSMSTFTQAQLDAGNVTYTHNGSNTTSDSFVFKVSDGTNALTNQVFSITVNAVDDDTPTIATNAGLELNEGATKAITLDELEADDNDTNNSTLIFTITTAPAHGQVENADSPGTAISSFTQQNLTDGKIQYVHDGSNTTSDSFVFKVSDGTNALTNQVFSITVNAVDDDTPTIATNAGLELNEGATKAITLDELEADDNDTNNSTLIFTITTAPAHGQVENTDSPGTVISSFTQQNLIDRKIQYVHDGSNTTSDSFTFKVSEGRMS